MSPTVKEKYDSSNLRIKRLQYSSWQRPFIVILWNILQPDIPFEFERIIFWVCGGHKMNLLRSMCQRFFNEAAVLATFFYDNLRTVKLVK